MEQSGIDRPITYRLFLGNLGSRLTETDVRNFVAPYGSVKTIQIVKDRITGRSSGYGFIEMNDIGQADRVVSELKGKSVGGHTLIVRPLY